MDMHGTTTVPKSVFDSIQNKATDLIFDMGNGYVWRVNGKSVVSGRAADIDLTVTKGDNIIPSDLVSNIAGEQDCMQIRLAHNGEFGFTAVLFMNVDKKNAGLEAKLYYYNKETNALEFIGTGIVDENGIVGLTFTHASDYVIVMESKKYNSLAKAPKTGEDDLTIGEIPTVVQRVNEHNWTPLWIVFIIAAGLIAAIGIYYVRKDIKGDMQ